MTQTWPEADRVGVPTDVLATLDRLAAIPGCTGVFRDYDGPTWDELEELEASGADRAARRRRFGRLLDRLTRR